LPQTKAKKRTKKKKQKKQNNRKPDENEEKKNKASKERIGMKTTCKKNKRASQDRPLLGTLFGHLVVSVTSLFSSQPIKDQICVYS
jgi:hypothetical protein